MSEDTKLALSIIAAILATASFILTVINSRKK